MPKDIRPFEEIRLLFANLPAPCAKSLAAVRARDAQLTKPPGALGRLEEIVEWLAAWQGKAEPTIDGPLVAVFAANHGVVAKGVSAFPPSVTQQMLDNFTAGGAAINQICKSFGVGLKVFELALEHPTGDFSEGPAMEENAAAATLAYGMEAIDGGIDLLAPGEMGIGNTTSAAAIYAALYGGPASKWTGRGTGVDDEGLARKNAVIDSALALHGPHLSDPLEILRRLGGREIAGMMGAILAARLNRIPVVLDGFVACSAAALLHAMDENAIAHCIAGHVSPEGGHREVLRRLGKKPLLDLDMRLGEGSGAAMAIGVVKGALACHRGMATFESAGVSGKS
ncbi:nicotinate-nucleotide--dimethylbenzimidazole phosphoribosyltransferase [Methylocystis heyeri]|uniref:Nicotinate-nucleotide--dimethylbenzimidazole phosphoribosyltransferase n=1 Tax=Methylocystis heyeri TaxID=391905 RepID=A0A6B8KIH1_9HYPH|nr:nicotinate-nucleotide--dimethylbenzimidazole phosphoribosyltransferase [Methylocystis heyeri]QGM46310.1 nicotinate-nucleotide--dimethylbenzimidazole phosphoribosyltransferase [Methylocystis heyeri]